MDLPNFGEYYLKSILETELDHFTCDPDLEKYFKEHAKDNEEELIAKTYFLHKKQIMEPLVGFSLSNNVLQASNEISMSIVSTAHHKVYPAVLIGRLATHSKHLQNGYGRMALDLIKTWFIAKNKTGCRFIVVDSRKDSLDFYKKNQFILYDEETIPNQKYFYLYFDLKDYETELRKAQVSQ
ncbi:GNAT family N-acetyltransferase [Leptospira santarosai]|uniref:GNAT family N-acetyltransferase n=1 Tax=Leptospira santarosai TaxID=28183 RepID=UPI0024AFD90E|nr:GNAT family N-acetyltransferase [Leptospira santarosai]MDI7165916.1 N-acetyltransferase [Leptospira santarosai]